MKNYKLIPKITLWTLLGLGIVVAGLFFLIQQPPTGGDMEKYYMDVAGEQTLVPRFTGLFLVWNYVLLGLAALATLVVVIIEFCKNLQNDRAKALKTLGFVIGFIVLAVICWALGSSEPMNIVGFELHGTEQEIADWWAFWGKLADAVIYFVYILFFATIVTMICGAVIRRIRK